MRIAEMSAFSNHANCQYQYNYNLQLHSAAFRLLALNIKFTKIFEGLISSQVTEHRKKSNQCKKNLFCCRKINQKLCCPTCLVTTCLQNGKIHHLVGAEIKFHV